MVMILLLLLLIASAVLAFVATKMVTFRRRLIQSEAQLANERARYNHDMKQWHDYSAKLKAHIQRLSKYAACVDAEDRAEELLRSAQATLDKANGEAGAIVAKAQEQAKVLDGQAAALVEEARREADAIVAEARQQAKGLGDQGVALLEKARGEADSIAVEARKQAKALRDDASSLLDSATAQAGKIVEAAHKRAEEIAGSAYEALQNAALYERTVTAMKNTIEGYGDQYLVPGHSLLDDLAEDFGHTQAGQEFKQAKERTKSMIRNGTAATCDYVENRRRDTAIDFVIDAFNGKVDSVLSRVRYDNAGTLEQEIRDAFSLVNFNGKAFRSAQVTEQFLDARLDELKWAAIVQQLKLDEREEQRRIKEQLREEEKARKEYERAIRDAAKEEDMLRRAMEKARQQVEQASAEQRTKYEQQLLELGQRLKEAEERNQRALSMAQLTRRGHVYIISNIGSFGEHVYKIGLTRRLEPLDRIRELGDSSVPFEFDVHALILSDDAPALETQLHNHFILMQMNKVNHRKEFFQVDLKHIREEVEKMELNVKWTMTAEARQYRESLAVEQAIKDNPAARDAWVKRQLELEPIVNEDIEDSPLAIGESRAVANDEDGAYVESQDAESGRISA